jgi:hypothetical protein
MNFDTEATSLGFVLLSIVTLYLVHSWNAAEEIHKLISRPGYILQLAFVIIWSIVVLKFNSFNIFASKERSHRLKKATSHGLIALIIATLAYIDLTIPTFWFVMLIAFYIEMPSMAGVY